MSPPSVVTTVETQVVSPDVTLSPSVSQQPDEGAVGFPEVFPKCAVTQAMSWAKAEGADEEVGVKAQHLPDFPLSLSCSELLTAVLVRKWVPHGEDFVGIVFFKL